MFSALLLVCSASGFAGTVKWTGLAGDGLWATGGNWDNNVGPASTDDVLFPGNLAGAISVNLGANRTVQSIVFGDASGAALTSVTFTGAFILTLTPAAAGATTMTSSIAAVNLQNGITGASTTTGSVIMTANQTWNITSGIVTLTFALNGNPAAVTLTKNGAGQLTLSADCNRNTGIYNGGTIRMLTQAAIVGSGATVFFNDGTTLDQASNTGRQWRFSGNCTWKITGPGTGANIDSSTSAACILGNNGTANNIPTNLTINVSTADVFRMNSGNSNSATLGGNGAIFVTDPATGFGTIPNIVTSGPGTITCSVGSPNTNTVAKWIIGCKFQLTPVTNVSTNLNVMGAPTNVIQINANGVFAFNSQGTGANAFNTLPNPIVLNGGTLQTAGITGGDKIFSGDISAQTGTTSTISLDDSVTPATARNITLSGKLSNASGTGVVNIAKPSSTASPSSLTLTNTGGTFVGILGISAGATINAQGAGTLGLIGSTVQLTGGTLKLQSDIGNANFLANLSIGGTADSNLIVDRITTGSNLTLQLGGLSFITAGRKLIFSSTNGYNAAFTGGGTLTGSCTLDSAINVSIAGSLSGAGANLSKISNGTLTMSGTNNTFDGGMAITSGSFFPSGIFASSISFNTPAALGIFSPGGSGTIGSVTCPGLTLAGGTASTFDCGAPGINDKVVITGVAAANVGGALTAADIGGYSPGTYTLVDASGGPGTVVDNISAFTTPPGFTSTKSITGNKLVLTVDTPGGTWAASAPSGIWSAPGNWQANALPVSGTSSRLFFPVLAGANNPYTSTNDLASPTPFVLNVLNLNTLVGGNTIAGGPLQFDGTGSAIQQSGSGSFTIQNNLVLNANTSILGSSPTIGGIGGVTLSGQISGPAGLISNNPGASVLTLSNPGGNTYLGNTTISTGMLVVNNATGSGTSGGTVTLAAGTTLAGTGNLAGAVTLNGASNLVPGTLTPGNIGQLRTGPLTLNSSATLNFDVGAPGTNDSVAVSGNLTLAGNLVIGNTGAAMTPGAYNNLFTYTGVLTNQNVNLIAPTTFSYQVQTPANQVNLAVLAAGGTSIWQGTGTTGWTTPANWDTMPGSALTTTLVFPTLAAPYVANNTFPNGFSINNLTITSTAANSITGSQFALGGTNPAINQNAASGTFAIGAMMSLNANTTFGGTGAGTVSIGGVISGNGALTVSGPGTYILTNDANSYTGTTTINGGTLLVQNPTTPGILNTASPLGNASSAISITNGKLQLNPGVDVTTLARPIVFNNSSEFYLQRRGDITPAGGWTINAIAATPAKFRYPNALNWGGTFTVPTLTATAANTLRLELNDGVNNGVGGALALAALYPCNVIIAGVPGGNPSATSVLTPTNVAKVQLGQNYNQSGGTNPLTFENVVQIGATGAGRLINSDLTIANGITVISGRGTGTGFDASSHETVIPAGKTLTVQSGATANIDMGFRQDVAVYGGVFQLCNTVLSSSTGPATLRYLRSDPAAIPGGGRSVRMLLCGGNIIGTGPNSVVDLQVDTRDGGYASIDSIVTNGTTETITTSTPHGFAANDVITVGHDEQGTAGGIAPAPVFAAGTFGNFKIDSVTANTIVFVNTAAASNVTFTTKPVVGLVGVAFNSNCNLVVNGGLTVQGTAARIGNLLASARLNGVIGSGGFLAPKPTGAPLVIPANSTTWPNKITLQVQHATAATDIQLGGAFANNIMVGATPAETAATLDGNGQTVSSITGPIAVRGYGTITGSLFAGANASVWPGTTARSDQLIQNEVLLASGTSTINLSAGKFKTVIAKGASVFRQQLTVASGGVLTLGPASVLSLGVLTGNYGVTDIPIVTCGSATITAPFGVTLGLPIGWQVIYRAGGSDILGNIPSALTPADAIVIRTTAGNVTPVTLEAFAATPEGAGVLLSWNAISEFQNAGFNAYRRRISDKEPRPRGSGEWTRVNPALIPGRISSADFKTYRAYDWPEAGVHEYKLESVSISGLHESYPQMSECVCADTIASPISAEALAAALGSTAQAEQLDRGASLSAKFAALEPRTSAAVPQTSQQNPALILDTHGKLVLAGQVNMLAPYDGQTNPVARLENQKVSNREAQFTSPGAGARWFSSAPSRGSASATVAKVVYDKSGVLRIPQAMLPAGFNLDRVSIQREGRDLIPLAKAGGDLIVFAPGYQDEYTDKDALFIRKCTATAAGHATLAQGLFSSALPVNAESSASVTAEYHDVYFDFNYRPYNFAPWFSSQYLTGGTTQSFTLDAPRSGSGSASLTVRLWSLTESDDAPADHALQVLVNGQPAGQAVWRGGNKMLELTFQLGSGVLAGGTNRVDLVTPTLEGISQQISFLHSMTLAYTQELKGSQASDIYNNSVAPKLFELSGLSSANAWVVDARYPDRAALLAYESHAQADGSFTLRFVAPSGGSGHFIVVPEGQENAPLSVSKRTLKPIKSGAYLAVGPNQFSAGVQPLLQQRAKEGLRGSFADQEQIFDYYGYGRYGPGAIQNAVRTVRPQYLLLLGRTTYDYHNYSGLGVDPLCPTFLVSTTFWAQATSDSMFGDLGRGYAEVAVGRLPVNDASELAQAVRRILSHKGSAASGPRLHAVADRVDPEAGDFAAQADSIAHANPSLTWQRNYLGVTAETSPEVTAALKDAANGGADAILYLGHGNAVRLGNTAPRILDTDSVQEWTGNIVLLQSTCTANWMAKNESRYRSIAIQALTQPQGGIAASLGSSTYLHSDISTEFMSQLLRHATTGSLRWGDALKKTQIWAHMKEGAANSCYSDLHRTEQLFGDPAMPVQAKTPTGVPPGSTGKF